MKIIIIGGGFAGVYAAKKLKNKAEVTLITENDKFLYTPLLHQGMFGSWSLEGITLDLKNLGFNLVQDKIISIDSVKKIVKGKKTYEYDKLIIATGARTNFFGVKGAEENSLTFKNVKDASMLRQKAKTANSAVIVGGGATGVELAAELAELGLEIELIEGNKRLLKAFPKFFSERAEARLIKLGVKVSKGYKVVGVQKNYVKCETTKHHGDIIIWTAGVQANTIAIDNKLVRSYEVDLTLKLQEDIYALGDVISGYPKLAQAAVKQAKIVVSDVLGNNKEYVFKLQGLLLSVGSGYALAQAYGLRFSGRIGWIIWNSVYSVKFLELKFRTKIIKDCWKSFFA